MKILILSSSFEGNLTPIIKENYTIFSANWGICYGVPIDYYFCSTVEPLLINEINKKHNLIKNWMITQNVKNSLSFSPPVDSVQNLFDFLQTIDSLGKKHMLPKNKRNGLNLPTTGVQMIYAASKYSPKEVFIRGINLYTVKNSNGGYKIHGNTFLENPYLMKNKPHSLRTDLLFIYSSFKRLIESDTLISCDSKILTEILEDVNRNVSMETCYNKILKKYY